MITFLCLVVAVTDADTIRCASGERIRIAAINAREKDGSCIPNAPCVPTHHAQAKPAVERLAMGRTLRCRQVGVSYRRIVADCALPNGAGLSCAIVRSGAAAWWPKYARQYRMRGCT